MNFVLTVTLDSILRFSKDIAATFRFGGLSDEYSPTSHLNTLRAVDDMVKNSAIFRQLDPSQRAAE